MGKFRLLFFMISAGMLNYVSSQVETGDGNPIPASLFFGVKGSHFSNIGSESIQITQMRNSYNYGDTDSPILIPDGANASVDPSANESSVSFHAGLNLGWFPKFSTFRFADGKQVIALGTVFDVAGNFGDGAGFTMGFSPEVNYQVNKWGIHGGVQFGFNSIFKKLGDFQLEGVDRIIVRSESLDGCSEDDFKGGNNRCRMHDNNSTVRMSASTGSTSPYLRLAYMYNEEKNSGVGLVIGHRFAGNQDVDYVLRGDYEYDPGGQTENTLNGPEFENLSNAFDFSGLFVQLELVFRPFKK